MHPVPAPPDAYREEAHAGWDAAGDTVCAASTLCSFRPLTIFGRKINEKYDKVFSVGCQIPDTSQPRANATFVVLARNKELEGVIQSLKSVERHFNRWYHYPYVFLNDGDFNSTFKETVANYTSGPVTFGKIDSSMWGYPAWADKDAAVEGIRQQGDSAIMYGGMESYHHMCRFYSGFVAVCVL